MILYDWLKALHVIAVIAWMAGMLYLPRLFVYHADAKPGSELSETLKVMERRLLRAIINPAMGAAWIFGLWMAWEGDLWGNYWFQVKLALVVLMSALHGFLSRWRRDFASNANRHSAKFYRIANEAVTVLLIGIVIMVIVRPF
ncbi:protoporphyrinogen oxidase HemJ [Dongia deserti]|uniref:protoporphyrinogen oxidase HemJ n=1 Tax=Dongia deserti TaxID=2268030 RepID=UPI000E64BDA5|nr:protoporphyrinogen oxidase HemJ [Dongia deserti]